MSQHEWKVGDKVAAPFGMDPDSFTVRKVERVLKRFVELNNGSQWTHDGHPYPHQQYNTRFIRPMTVELDAEIHRQRATRFLGKTNWTSLDTDTLDKIVELVRSKE